MKQMNPEEKKEKDIPRIGSGAHLFTFFCTLLCISFVVWAYYGKLDIVSAGDGRVVPSSKVKSIQHLEGGIVREILVKEGNHVKTGQPLMILEETTSGANVEELRIRTISLRVDIARLKASAGETKSLKFPKDLIQHHPDLVSQSKKLFADQMKKHRSDISSQKELIQQRIQDIKGLETRIGNGRKSLKLLEKQISISKGLLQDKLTTEYKHLDFLREKASLISRIEDSKSALKNARSALRGAQEKLKRLSHSFRQENGEKLKTARQDLEEFSQRLKKHTDSLKRTTIRSPVDGIVKTLYAVSVKGVIKPGMTIMDIVPGSDRLLVEGRLPIGDIGYVQPGQRAIIKLASRDAGRFDKVEGKVIHISPDAYTTQAGAFYIVRIETEKDYFERENLQYKFYPGLQVLTFIHTGQRTVFEYLVDPFLNTLKHSLQER